jgi:predicted RND superfamily exporter protein/lauroyl/myristoyl acyltransferase
MKRTAYWPWLLLLLPIAFGLFRLRFDVEVLDLLPPDLKVVQGLKLYQQQFANARELIITVKTEDAEGTEDVAQRVANALRKETNLVSSVIWQPPWLEHPEQSAELLAFLWLNQPPAEVHALTNRLAPENLPGILTAARDELSSSMSPAEIGRLSYDPYGLTRLPEKTAGAAPAFGQGQEMFSSPDGTFRIMFVQASHDLPTYKDCARWLQSITNVVAGVVAVDSWHGRVISYTGRPAFVAEVAGGMEHDISTSVGGTAVIIAVLFYFAHRRWKPMLWLVTLLALILGSTLAIGGLLFGHINVVSMGFAAILLGLAVDYAVVHYQEALAHPDLTIPQIRRAIAPSIFWAAVTTISAFLVLNFGGLPGLAQLGSLVGLGVALSACVMIFAFLPPLFPDRWGVQNPDSDVSKLKSEVQTTSSPLPSPPKEEREKLPQASGGTHGKRLLAVYATTALVIMCALVLCFGLPKMDPTANALRPRNSQAYTTLDEIKNQLNQKREPLWLLVSGTSEKEVCARLEQLEPILQKAAHEQLIASYTLPSALCPKPEFQEQNRVALASLVSQRADFHEAAKTNGFAENSLALADRILDTWTWATAGTNVFWPTNEMSRWIFDKVVARTRTNYYFLGFLNPSTNAATSLARLQTLEARLPQDDVWLSGWELLGNGIFSSVKQNMWKLIVPMVSLVMLSLLLAFRAWREVLLSILVLLLSGACLLTAMRLAGWSWNLLNLMALPLILGTGVDYSIFMQLALRRYHGDLRMAHKAVGRALLLCGATAIAGFGSLAWSSNAGMASLGAVCAVGIAGNMLISVLLLPWWWSSLAAPASRRRVDGTKEETRGQDATAPSGPSSLYQAKLWKAGLWAARVIPTGVCTAIVRVLANVYWVLAWHRREVVIQNLLPPLNGNRRVATITGRHLMNQFALKLVDLWRYEAGLEIGDLLGQAGGWEHFQKARAEKRGILLITPHLGNWEFGGPLLTRAGVTLQVITLAEPGVEFTKLRQESRKRWNIETLVIGNDAFAFVEIIRRLEAGATVALLIDRPPDYTAIDVQLFGKPFRASVAAAELARASGCVILPVFLPRNASAYAANMLAEIPYDRAALRDRTARQELTQRIMTTFEPIICEHLDQWYHFVPLWENEMKARKSDLQDPSAFIKSTPAEKEKLA